MINKKNVQVGQIWQDWDIRFRSKSINPRLIKVICIENNFATL